MASYLSSWFTSSAPTPAPIPSISLRISPPPEIPDSDDEHGADDDEEGDTNDLDRAPAFPSMNSIQRAGSSRSTIRDSELMPPPSNSLQLPPSTTSKPKPKSRKVALAPGHSALDWARLKSSGEDLRVRSFNFNDRYMMTEH